MSHEHDYTKTGGAFVCSICGYFKTIITPNKELKVTELTWKEYKEWKNKKTFT